MQQRSKDLRDGRHFKIEIDISIIRYRYIIFSILFRIYYRISVDRIDRSFLIYIIFIFRIDNFDSNIHSYH